jgi:hypothetical protein
MILNVKFEVEVDMLMMEEGISKRFSNERRIREETHTRQKVP